MHPILFVEKIFTRYRFASCTVIVKEWTLSLAVRPRTYLLFELHQHCVDKKFWCISVTEKSNKTESNLYCDIYFIIWLNVFFIVNIFQTATKRTSKNIISSEWIYCGDLFEPLRILLWLRQKDNNYHFGKKKNNLFSVNNSCSKQQTAATMQTQTVWQNSQQFVSEKWLVCVSAQPHHHLKTQFIHNYF